ncbi:hypothetical protein [Bacillus sp. FJAT-49736]|uniref:hypothetical protein n=1 Tax=Bacillus sp. FJAT-49736 TaxID=2833582 RepID=UPI001BC9085F|nr:hypothetical protein [Bacillus sp. FJAT-49736]MBS4173514.1 hypothetical protein [Bacillus sp. FJAT-49736]
MNKEKFMQLVEEALDKGHYIAIHFSQFDKVDGKFIPVNHDSAMERLEIAQSAFEGEFRFDEATSDDQYPSYWHRGKYITVSSSYMKEELQ